MLRATIDHRRSLFARLRPQRIAVVRALYLGDMLCAVPAFHALRRALPDAHIALIGLPWSREFARRYSFEFNEFIEFPGCPGLPERDADPARVEEFLEYMRRARFDLVMQLHGSGRYINDFLHQTGARATAGFFLDEIDVPVSEPTRATSARRLGDDYRLPQADAYVKYPSDLHEIQRHLRLVQWLSGARNTDANGYWPLSPDDLREADALLGDVSTRTDRAPVCLHPGARYLSRRWPVERFAAVGNRLGREGWPIVITGSGEEEALGRSLSDALDVPHRCLMGKTSLGGLFGIAARAGLVITNDTGMSHVAAAVRTPSVVLHLGSDARRWAPLDGQRHRLVSAAVDCRPCEYRECPIGHPCAFDLSADVVLAAARYQLQHFPPASDRNASHPVHARS